MRQSNPFLLFLSSPFRFIGSIGLGIVLLTVLLILLAWGTFVESEYGSAAAKFVLYENIWFAALLALLGINVFVAVLLRFPWGKYFFPFFLVHIGILVLFFGCCLTWKYGIEAQITLSEGTVGRSATRTDKQQLQFNYIEHQYGDKQKPFIVDFEPGPFNWQDYNYDNWMRRDRKYKTSLWYALQFAHRDKGTLPSINDKSLKVEVLDYLADSALEAVPPAELNILWKNRMSKTKNDLGEDVTVPRNWESVRLEMRQQMPGLLDLRGANVSMSQNERVTFFSAISHREVEAFQTSRPEGGKSFGFWGELVFYYGGENYHVNVDDILNLQGNQRLPLGKSGLQLGDVRFRDRGPIVHLTVFASGGTKESLTLFPDNPEMNVQARQLGVFGSYWVDPQKLLQNRDYSANPAIQRLAHPRLDFVQGTDKKLYYRLWSGEKIIADGVAPEINNNKPEFTVADGTPLAADIILERFVPQDVPGSRIVSQPAGQSGRAEQRVKMRVHYDGNEDTFWIRAVTPTVIPLPPEPDQIRYIYGNGKTLCVRWDFERIDLGFSVFLKKFEQRTEPGTKMSSYYSSLVDFVEQRIPGRTDETFSRNPDDFQALLNGKDILISMNRPAYFKGTGREYRIYQSSYMGPYHPNQPQFFELYDGRIFEWETKPRESISMSTLSVNCDPGRGWKYAGCLLIFTGTAMFVWRRKK